MIRVDLFAGTAAQDKQFSLLKSVFVVVVSLLVAVALSWGGFLAIRAMTASPSTASAARAAAPSTSQAPSPLVTRPYRTLPLSLRVPYEMHFARQVMDIIRSFPAEVLPPQSIVVDSFAVAEVSGVSKSKAPVVAALNAFRKGGVELLPKPRTSVSSSGGAYTYTFAGHVQFPIDTRDTDYTGAVGRLPKPDRQSDEVGRFERLAQGAGVKIRRGLRYVSAQKAGSYKRFVYKMDASATYEDFARFLGDLHTSTVSCAFGSLSLKAGRSGRMSAKATLYFTTKE